jgi:enoyl-CoA hydratase/carnithine racemase
MSKNAECRVLCEVTGSVARVTLNRPAKLNALDYETVDTLSALLDAFEADRHVGVVVLTGAGDKAFSAGADIAQFSASVREGVEPALRSFLRRGQDMTRRIENFPKPVIAAVNGLAYGGGCEIVEAAHLAIASERARFCKSEIRLGMPPTFGGTQRLPRLVGRKRALEMILTAEPIDAEHAAAYGLVNRIVPHDGLSKAVDALAERLLEQPRIGLSACLASVTRGLNVSIDEGLAIEAAQFARTISTRDIHEGTGAFLEKRQPVFSGC